MAEPLTATDELDLIDAVRDLDARVSAGVHPTKAAAEVARARGYDPGRTELICHTYNTGHQLHRWENPSSIEKLAAYPLADAAAAIQESYTPSAVEKVARDYCHPPTWVNPRPAAPVVKQAREAPAPTARQQRTAAEKAAHYRDRCREAVVAAESDLNTKVASLRQYFRGSTAFRCSYPAFAKAASVYLGPEFAPLVQYAGGEISQAEKSARIGAMDDASVPLGLLRECRSAADNLLAAQHALATAEADYQAKRAAALPPVPPPMPPPAPPPMSIIPTSPFVRKQAAAGLLAMPAVGTAIGSMLAQSTKPLQGQDPDTAALVEKLNDPNVDAEMRRIQVQAALTRLMTDPDDPISGYDPARVVDVFNQISSLSPRAVTQPAALGPLLRRQLAGTFEPFEAAQALQMDKELATRFSMPPAPQGGPPRG